jgi:hypothetical protein
MNEAPVANPGVKTVANARGTPAEQKSQARLLGKMARAQKNEAPAPAAPVMA